MSPFSTFVFLLLFSFSSPAEIKQLPGLNVPINFKHYSGYFQVSEKQFLHYWFTESQNDPAHDPVMLWLNGGPGCSSVAGLLTELGPFQIEDDWETVSLRKFSWNKFANVLFLETPAGVGYSYSSDDAVSPSDDSVSKDNYEALKRFMDEFPQFKSNDLYLAGESYGGIYIPTLMERILDGKNEFPINIKGMAIGNGILDYDLNTDSLMNFAFNHGLVDEKLWEKVLSECCKNNSNNCPFHSFRTGICADSVRKVHGQMWHSGLNVYDLYRDCDHQSPGSVSRFQADLRGLAPPAAVKFLQQNPTLAQTSVPCVNETAITKWLNRKDVREALFIPASLPEWNICSNKVIYKYQRQYETMSAQFRKALDNKVRILVYYGDTDMACNFLMGQEFANLLNIPVKNVKRPWKYNRQTAGFVTEYQNLDFVTVKGSGHMVPQWRPGPAYHMITAFINQTPY